MADSYHIIDGKVVPYSGGRKCNDTDAWRDATPLELQLQEQLEEYERTTDAQEAEIEALRAEVDMLRGKVDEAVVELLCRKARAERLAEALRLALNSHGKTLLTDPPQDAWKVNRVEEIGRALLRDQENNDA